MNVAQHKARSRSFAYPPDAVLQDVGRKVGHLGEASPRQRNVEVNGEALAFFMVSSEVRRSTLKAARHERQQAR